MKIAIIIFLLVFIDIHSQIYLDFGSDGINSNSTFLMNIGRNNPKYLIQIKIDSIALFNLPDLLWGRYQIEIYDSLKSELAQKIIDTSFCSPSICKIIFVDLNFDNYLDLALLKETHPVLCSIFNFWLYEEKTRQFKYSKEFSNLPCQLQIDILNKNIIYENYSWSTKDYIMIIYKIEENKPIIFKKVHEYYLKENLKYYFVSEEFNITDKKLEKTKSKKEEISENEYFEYN